MVNKKANLLHHVLKKLFDARINGDSIDVKYALWVVLLILRTPRTAQEKDGRTYTLSENMENWLPLIG